VIAILERNARELTALCLRYGVLRLELFGSAATGAFNPVTSDLDFIAVFDDADKPGYARRYIEFAEALEHLFGCPIDLLTERSITNRFFRDSVNNSRITLYESRNQKVVA
jgi:predicted nucleotidyltransferase